MAEELSLKDVVSQVKEANATFKDEVILKAKTEVEATNKEVDALKTELKAVQEDSVKKGATIIQLQEEVKGIMTKAGRKIITSVKDATLNMYETMATKIGESKDMFERMYKDAGYQGEPLNIKASTVTTSSLTTQAYGTYLDWQPGMEPIGQTRVRQLARVLQSETDTVYYPVANIPVGAGSFAYQKTEGNAKAQVDRGYDMKTLTLYALAGWLTASRQSLRNIIFLQSWLPTSLNEQLLDREDLEFANTIVAGATGSSNASGKTVNVEVLIYLIKNLIATKYKPSAIAVDPSIWASMLITKPQNYSLPSVVTVNPVNGNVMILGIPVYPVNWLTGGRCIVADWSKIAVVESEGLTLRQSQDATSGDFTKNLVTFLLERVEGVALFRPDAIITAILT